MSEGSPPPQLLDNDPGSLPPPGSDLKALSSLPGVLGGSSQIPCRSPFQAGSSQLNPGPGILGN